MTTRISMIPNNDVQVIHASQGDTEREWEFELYDNEGLIDTSSIGQQTVYPVYAGGTEQLLPANTATPVTSPMLADIQYPDQLRLEQYFTYRQCPTASDGKAKVKKMYGNSIVFNQLVQNGNFADTSGWTSSRGTIAAQNNELSYTITQLSSTASNARIEHTLAKRIVPNHKYYFRVDCLPKYNNSIRLYAANPSDTGIGEYISFTPTANVWNTFSIINAFGNDFGDLWLAFNTQTNYAISDVIKVKNYMFIDLTQMGLDSLTAQEIEALFSLPYYSYNTGTLLAFNGTGIKTTGGNLFNFNTVVKGRIDNGVIGYESGTTNLALSDGDVTFTTNAAWRGVASDYIRVKQGTYKAIFKVTVDGAATITENVDFYDMGKVYVDRIDGQSWGGGDKTVTITVPADGYIRLSFVLSVAGTSTIGKIAFTKNNAYAPYEEHLTPLPISDYFPSGMKSAGTVYDELSESSAVTRIGTRAYQAGDENDPTVITDKTTTYYPLDNPQTVSFVSASFVSQNIETEMTADNGKLYAKSDGYTENAGVFPCKIKIASDGVAYSSEFKLHVERKP